MTIELTPEDKLPIIQQHIKSILVSQYNINLGLIEANAFSNPDANIVSNLNSQLAQSNSQIAALQKEYDAVNAKITTTPTE